MSNGKKDKIGSIYYDKNLKKWRCIYYIFATDGSSETRKTKSFLTEQEAKNFLTSIQFQKGNDLFIKSNGIPLNKLMRENLQKKLDLNLITERTYARTMETIRGIEKSPIAYKNISDITSMEIQAFLNTLKNFSNSTIKKYKEQFSQAFRFSFNNGYITQNPMNNVIRPKSTQIPKSIRALDLTEQQILTDYLLSIPISIEIYKVVFLIEMYMGLRMGEILALRNTDIYLQKNLITLNKTLSTDKDGKIIMKFFPKTSAGVRQVPIPYFIKDAIIEQMLLAKNNKDKQLFLNSQGNYVRPNNVNRRLKELCEKLEINTITSHILRHTFATRCIEAGMRAVALQRLMGHADISVTLNTYTSVFNKYKESELEKVNDYYLNNAVVSNSKYNDLTFYNLNPKDWKVLENETAKVKSEYNLLSKSFNEIDDFRELEKQIEKYKKEIEKLKEKLKNFNYISDKEK